MSTVGPEQDPITGRWKSNGRRAALSCLDAVLGEERNMQKLRTTFQEQIDNNTMDFFTRVVIPLIPPSMREASEGGDNSPEAKAAQLQFFLRQIQDATAGAQATVMDESYIEGGRPTPSPEEEASDA